MVHNNKAVQMGAHCHALSPIHMQLQKKPVFNNLTLKAQADRETNQPNTSSLKLPWT